MATLVARPSQAEQVKIALQGKNPDDSPHYVFDKSGVYICTVKRKPTARQLGRIARTLQ